MTGMNREDMEELRYPIGRFTAPEVFSEVDNLDRIAEIERFPGELAEAVAGLSADQLDTAYRPGGWTLRQVVHHLPDSHLNAYARFKLALTEDNPVIRPYREDLWAETAEAREGEVQLSLDLLGGLHRRWAALLRSLSPADFGRTFYHPENLKTFRLDTVLALYVWHCRHHLAQITGTALRHGW